MSVTSSHRPWPADEPSQAYPVGLTSAVTFISRASSFGTSQSPESVLSTTPDRRSHVGVCKPLRSSPLASSVLQADDETIAQGKETPTKLTNQPSRIVSTPDLASILTRPPLAKRSRPRTAEGFSSRNMFLTPVPPPTYPEPIKGCATAISHALYSGNSAKQASTTLGRSASSTQSSFSAFPTRAVGLPMSKAGSTPHLRAALCRPDATSTSATTTTTTTTITTHGCATAPSPLLVSSLKKKTPPVGRSSSVHRHSGDNSWLIANPYEITPKFTRLGLASPHVVLPLCAREHRRLLARENSKSSVKTSTARISRVRSTPSSTSSSSGTRLSSCSHSGALNPPSPSPSPSPTQRRLSNWASEPGFSSVRLPRPQRSVAPVISSGRVVTFEGEASDLPSPSPSSPSAAAAASKSDHDARSVPSAGTLRKSPLVHFKNLTHRTFKSLSLTNKSSLTPIIDDDVTPVADRKGMWREIKIGFVMPRSSSPTASESTSTSTTVDTKAADVGAPPTMTMFEKEKKKKKKTMMMMMTMTMTEQGAKKSWKPFAIWCRNRSR